MRLFGMGLLSRQHVIHLFQGVFVCFFFLFFFFNKRSLAINIFMSVYPAVYRRTNSRKIVRPPVEHV